MLTIANPPSVNDASSLRQHGVNPEDLTSRGTHDLHKKKKRKKRQREEGHEDHNGEELKKKKKRKGLDSEHHLAEVEQTAFEAPTQVSLADLDAPLKKKKSKKKDKGKEVAQPTPVDPNAQASALLSAIVAAAAGTPDVMSTQHMQMPPPHFHPHMSSHPQQPHLIPYPGMPPYGFGAPPPFHPGQAQHPSMFPPPMGLPFSELAFGSNEDVLRALQDLDMSKIANVLKTLGDAAAAANVTGYGPPPPGFIAPPLPDQEHPTALGQVPVGANDILGFPSAELNVPTHHRRTLDMSLPGNEQHTSPDHAQLLATKWMNASKLAELVRTQGLIYKKGKFSAIEEQQIKAAMDHYRNVRNMTEEQLQDVIFPKNEKNKDNAFWSELTMAVPQRPIIAVYHHVRRVHHHMKPQGSWNADEDAVLKQAVMELGQRWEKISERVGRRSADCRDRYRNHIEDKEKRINGPWSKQEEERLTKIVTDMTVKQGKDIDNDVFWGKVSKLMDGTRGRQQCRIKWTDALSKMVKNEGQKPRWSQQDAFILVHKIDSLNVRDDTEIDWKTLSDPDWNLWSAHTLQRRWLTMKKSVKGFEDMTHQEIMDILRIKKAHLPPPRLPSAPKARNRKERKVISAAAVTDTIDANGHGELGSRGAAASSDGDDSDSESTDSDED